MAKERPYTIYLVDDDSKHLLLLKDHLEKKLPFQLNIATYTDGDEVVKALRNKPDIIVLDYYFDGSGDEAADGVDVLKKIRKIDPEVPVVMMSHQDKVEVAVTCYDYGVKDYIVKNETAFMRAQLVIRNIIYEIIKEEKTQEFRSASRFSSIILGSAVIILLILIAFLLYQNFS